jgi:hypothetical protein
MNQAKGYSSEFLFHRGACQTPYKGSFGSFFPLSFSCITFSSEFFPLSSAHRHRSSYFLVVPFAMYPSKVPSIELRRTAKTVNM